MRKKSSNQISLKEFPNKFSPTNLQDLQDLLVYSKKRNEFQKENSFH